MFSFQYTGIKRTDLETEIIQIRLRPENMFLSRGLYLELGLNII